MKMWVPNRDIHKIPVRKFDGYFEDIRILAKKTLPENTPPHIVSLLQPSNREVGLALTPAALINDVYLSGQGNVALELRDMNHVDNIDTSISQPYYPLSARARLHALAPAKGPSTKCCTKDRLVSGVVIYLAIAVFILLLTVVILAATLSKVRYIIN